LSPLRKRLSPLRLSVASLLVVASWTCSPRSIVAQAASHADAAQGEHREMSEEVWYGWQTLMADAVSMALVGLGAAIESGEIVGVGVASQVFAVPVIHAGHENGAGFAISLGLRIAGAIAATAAVLSSTRGGCPGDEWCVVDVDTTVAYFTVSILTLAVDAGWLAWEATEQRDASVD